MFNQWIDKGTIGVPVFKSCEEFLRHEGNCILNISDAEMKKFAEEHLGFKRDKGIDFIAKFNGKYIVAEAKFITDFGGHQNAQFDDAVRTMQSSFEDKKADSEVIPIAVMDGVLFKKGKSKMYRYLQEYTDEVIISALLLKEFLNTV